MRKITTFLFYIIAITYTLSQHSQAFAQEVIDSICAIADEEIILESEVGYGISSVVLEKGIKRPTESQLKTIRDQVLNAYITQKILLARADEESLMVEDRQVDKELARKFEQVVSQVGGEEKLEEYFGRPIRQIKREMRKGVMEGLLIDMVRRKHLVAAQVRRQDVIAFYELHKAELPILPERIQLSHILLEVTPSEEARRAAREKIMKAMYQLEEGAEFDSVAREYSEDPSAEFGGKLGFTNRGDLVSAYEEAAYALEPGEISSIVESPFGFHIIRVIERQGERISTQHILARLIASDADWEKAGIVAAGLADSLKNGADFTDFASRYSVDSSSKDKGGKLELMPVEQLPANFQTAIAGKSNGEFVDPFKTEFGYHILRIDNLIPSHTLALETDWEQLEQYALNFKREEQFQQWVKGQWKDHYIWPETLRGLTQ